MKNIIEFVMIVQLNVKNRIDINVYIVNLNIKKLIINQNMKDLCNFYQITFAKIIQMK